MKKIIVIIILSMFVKVIPQSLTIHSVDGEETILLGEIDNLIFEPDNMVFVAGETFLMGDHYNEGWGDELPVHMVTLNDFYISKFETTQAEFIEFLNDSEVAFDGSYNGNLIIDLDEVNCVIEYIDGSFVFMGSNIISSEDCPVVGVTWIGSCEYANWLSEEKGLDPCYEISINNAECNFLASGYRLPTEAEWEYASRGGVNWTDDFRYSGCHEWLDLSGYAWFNYTSASQIHPVGEKLPNQLGICDMSGNVYEFCWDWFASDYYEVSLTEFPTGPDSGEYHVSRGGDFNDDAQFCRVTARFSSYPYNTGGYLGFRLARTH